MTTTLLRRAILLGALGLFAAGPVVLFMGSAGASNNKTPLQTTRKNAGTPNSSNVVKNAKGVVVKYGDKYITYVTPASKLDKLGEALFMENCASCHGTQANGVPASAVGAYPNLVGLGPATIDFWIDSGRMPAKDTTAVEAPRRQPALTPSQAEADRGLGRLALAELPRHSHPPPEQRQASPRAPRSSPSTAPPVTPSRATAMLWPSAPSRRRCATSPPSRWSRRFAPVPATCRASPAT